MEERTAFEQQLIDDYNASAGELKGYDCPLCLNKGNKMILRDGYRKSVPCSCMEARENLRRIEQSGLSGLLSECTLENYNTPETWQEDARRTAERYISNYIGKWFCALGAVGSGKTHICTAICGELLNKGKTVRYMLWRDDSVKLKSLVNDDGEYGRLISNFKYADVLYIDDFFKTERGTKPTTADINLAFEILNYRYNDKNKATIISSERSIEELLDIDEAVGSRIYQRSKDYLLKIKGTDKNWRLR